MTILQAFWYGRREHNRRGRQANPFSITRQRAHYEAWHQGRWPSDPVY